MLRRHRQVRRRRRYRVRASWSKSLDLRAIYLTPRNVVIPYCRFECASIRPSTCIPQQPTGTPIDVAMHHVTSSGPTACRGTSSRPPRSGIRLGPGQPSPGLSGKLQYASSPNLFFTLPSLKATTVGNAEIWRWCQRRCGPSRMIMGHGENVSAEEEDYVNHNDRTAWL